VHLSGFIYCWQNHGAIPEVSWKWLQDTFGFTAPAQERRQEKKNKEFP
jgi:hypothetical protein